MIEISPKIKKWTLVIIGIIVIILLVTLGNYWYFQKKILQVKLEKEKIEIPSPSPVSLPLTEGFEQEIAKAKENCQANFDLNKLDFTAPIWWNTELSILLPQLIAMEAFSRNNEKKCDYFKNKDKIDPQLSIENCQRRYYFLKLIDELKRGMSCQNFIEECVKKDIPELEVEKEELEKTTSVVCESLCQSYQQKTPTLLGQENVLCDAPPSPQADTVDYIDPTTNQLKTCWSGLADEIKFLIAVSKNDANSCLNINNPKTSQFCQFYFSKNLEKYQNEFKETYCRNLVDSPYSPE